MVLYLSKRTFDFISFYKQPFRRKRLLQQSLGQRLIDQQIWQPPAGDLLSHLITLGAGKKKVLG